MFNTLTWVLDTALKVLKEWVDDIPFHLCTTDYLEECV